MQQRPPPEETLDGMARSGCFPARCVCGPLISLALTHPKLAKLFETWYRLPGSRDRVSPRTSPVSIRTLTWLPSLSDANRGTTTPPPGSTLTSWCKARGGEGARPPSATAGSPSTALTSAHAPENSLVLEATPTHRPVHAREPRENLRGDVCELRHGAQDSCQ